MSIYGWMDGWTAEMVECIYLYFGYIYIVDVDVGVNDIDTSLRQSRVIV